MLGGLLLCVVAAAGISLNFTLLRLTGEANDPVGKLSPRAVFLEQTTESTRTTTDPTRTTPETTPTTTEPVVTDDSGHGSDDGKTEDDDSKTGDGTTMTSGRFGSGRVSSLTR